MKELLEALEEGRGGCLVVERPGGAHIELPSNQLARVLSARATRDEQLLAYAGLATLCAPVLPLLDELPPVQASALRGALALGPPSGDALAVAAGFRSLLMLAAERGPVLVVVEDAHLLDRGSAAALAYASRRLDGAAVGIAIAQDPLVPGRLELPEARHVALPPPASPPIGDLPADRVDVALARALGRGSAVDHAAALEARAAATPSDHDRAEALLAAGQAWLNAGCPDQALVAARGAEVPRAAPALAPRAELLLGRIEAFRGNGRVSAAHLERAVALAGEEAHEVAAAASLLLVPPALFAGRVDDARASLERASAHTDAVGSGEGDPLRRMLVAAETAVALATGQPSDVDALVGLAEAAEVDVTDVSSFVTTVALPLIWLEREDLAVPLLERVVAGLRARGAIGALPMPLCALSVAERRTGRPTRALIVASEAKDLADQMGHRAARLFASSELANVHSLFGDIDRCRAAAQVVLDAGGSQRSAFRTSALSALATVELWSGDPARVIDLLEPLVVEGGALAPSVTLFHHTLLTAYVAVGRSGDALPLLTVLEQAAPANDGRLRATLARCEALLAPVEDRDGAFAHAVGLTGNRPIVRELTRLVYARRLLADGEIDRGSSLLSELSTLDDENLLGVARAARLSLARLGVAVARAEPGWAHLGPLELEVALSAADRVSVSSLADRLRLSPPEVERLRDDVLAVLGVRSGPAVASALRRPMNVGASNTPPVEIRLLGGLRVLVGGQLVDVPAGAVSTALGFLALRRTVHLEELTDVLWPKASPDLARRRIRNVLARARRAVGPIFSRHGERLELADDVVVDHHVLETRSRRALAAEPGSERSALLESALHAHEGTLLPELLYEDWTQAARRRSEARREDLLRALEEESAPP
ncbi:MAG: hypothetical protein ACOYXM_11990 [Actinomycetota bacterium]